MKLDKRILEGKKPLDCFDTAIAKQFIGKKGYFSHYIDNYADLKNTVLGTLGSTGDSFHESFCCTEEPFDIGDQIGFRSKDNGEVKHVMFVGYIDDFFADNSDRSDGENDVMIGIYRFSLSYLFDNYELLLEDGWQPFGIEE